MKSLPSTSLRIEPAQRCTPTRLSMTRLPAQHVELGVVDEEAARVAGDHVVLDHRVLDGAQHDAVVGVAPGPVVADHLVAHSISASPPRLR